MQTFALVYRKTSRSFNNPGGGDHRWSDTSGQLRERFPGQTPGSVRHAESRTRGWTFEFHKRFHPAARHVVIAAGKTVGFEFRRSSTVDCTIYRPE
jgi:hypothetical protein